MSGNSDISLALFKKQVRSHLWGWRRDFEDQVRRKEYESHSSSESSEVPVWGLPSISPMRKLERREEAAALKEMAEYLNLEIEEEKKIWSEAAAEVWSGEDSEEESANPEVHSERGFLRRVARFMTRPLF